MMQSIKANSPIMLRPVLSVQLIKELAALQQYGCHPNEVRRADLVDVRRHFLRGLNPCQKELMKEVIKPFMH